MALTKPVNDHIDILHQLGEATENTASDLDLLSAATEVIKNTPRWKLLWWRFQNWVERLVDSR